MMPTAMKMNMPAAPNGRRISGMRVKTTTSSITSMDSVGRGLRPATRSANIIPPFPGDRDDSPGELKGFKARYASAFARRDEPSAKAGGSRSRPAASPQEKPAKPIGPRGCFRFRVAGKCRRSSLRCGALGGLLDAALQAARFGRQLGVRGRQQIGVEAAVVPDGADRVDRQ